MNLHKYALYPHLKFDEQVRARFLDFLRMSHEESEVKAYYRKFLTLFKKARYAHLEEAARRLEELLVKRNIFSCFKPGVSLYNSRHPSQCAYILLEEFSEDIRGIEVDIDQATRFSSPSPAYDQLFSSLSEHFSGDNFEEFVDLLRRYQFYGIDHTRIHFTWSLNSEKDRAPIVESIFGDLTRPIVNAHQFRQFACSTTSANFIRQYVPCSSMLEAFEEVLHGIPQETFEDFSKVAEYEDALKSILGDHYDINKNFIVNLALAMERQLKPQRSNIIQNFLNNPFGSKARQDLQPFSLREAMAEIKAADNQIFF